MAKVLCTRRRPLPIWTTTPRLVFSPTRRPLLPQTRDMISANSVIVGRFPGRRWGDCVEPSPRLASGLHDPPTLRSSFKKGGFYAFKNGRLQLHKRVTSSIQSNSTSSSSLILRIFHLFRDIFDQNRGKCKISRTYLVQRGTKRISRVRQFGPYHRAGNEVRSRSTRANI